MLSTGLVITQLAAGLAKRGWSIRVYCGQPVYQDNQQTGERSPQYEIYEGVEIVRVGALGSGRTSILARVLNWVSFLCGIAWLLWRDRHELAGVINTTNPSIIGIIALFAKWIFGLPFVTIVHDVYPDVAVRLGVLRPHSFITRLWHRLTNAILKQSQGIVVLGRDMLALIEDKVGTTPVPIEMIPNWADPTVMRFVPFEHNAFAQQHNPDRCFVVQYAGRMGRTHNLDVLLDSAELLRDQPIRFQLIGDGAKRQQLQAQVKQRQLHNVQFLPYQPFQCLPEMLSTADLAVVCLDDAYTGVSVPSKTYNLMACGRPILGLLSPESEIGRTIQEVACGIVLPNATGEAIAQEIKMLADDKQKRTRMSNNSYNAFQEQFTLDSAVAAYDTHLHLWLPPTSSSRLSPLYRLFNAMLDLFFGLIGLAILLCIIPFVLLANFVTVPGPLFYWQSRVGLNGRVFNILKLRTMRVNAEAEGVRWAEDCDPRVTWIGRLLRATHLDELPQAYNILRGEMTLIGPRPERPEFTKILADELPRYNQRHVIQPGITGWAQVNQQYSASVEETKSKLDYDLFYIQHRSWWLDLVILIRTIKLMIGLNGR